MKVCLTLIFLVTLTYTSVIGQGVTPSPRTLDEVYGFRNARFETSLSAYPDMVLAEKAGQTRHYRRTGEKKQLGQGVVSDITYGFYQGKLAVVLIKIQGRVNSRAVLEELQRQAGPGKQSSPFTQRYTWQGQRVQMSYEENAVSNDALVVLTCKKLKEQELKQTLKTQPRTAIGK